MPHAWRGSCTVAKCSVPYCDLPAYSDLCRAHHARSVRHGSVGTEPVRPRGRSLLARIESMTTPEPNTGRMLWTGAVTGAGRPTITETVGGRKYSRVVARVVMGLTDRKLQANHTCHNGLCVNPKHLYVGTQKDNIRDMLAAGRGRWQRQACVEGRLYVG